MHLERFFSSTNYNSHAKRHIYTEIQPGQGFKAPQPNPVRRFQDAQAVAGSEQGGCKMSEEQRNGLYRRKKILYRMRKEYCIESYIKILYRRKNIQYREI